MAPGCNTHAASEGVKKKRQVSKKDDTVSKKDDTRCQKNRHRVKKIDTVSKKSTPDEPKPLPNNDYSTPQTIQTYSDFIKTLSEEERANFLNFVREKTKNLSQEVNDIEAWLASSNKAGQNRWGVYYSKYLGSKQAQSKTATKNALDEHRLELERQRQQALGRF